MFRFSHRHFPVTGCEICPGGTYGTDPLRLKCETGERAVNSTTAENYGNSTASPTLFFSISFPPSIPFSISPLLFTPPSPTPFSLIFFLSLCFIPHPLPALYLPLQAHQVMHLVQVPRPLPPQTAPHSTDTSAPRAHSALLDPQSLSSALQERTNRTAQLRMVHPAHPVLPALTSTDRDRPPASSALPLALPL
jgi:hypothetical protein